MHVKNSGFPIFKVMKLVIIKNCNVCICFYVSCEMGQTCQVLPGNPTSSLYVGVIGVGFAPVHKIREKQNDCFKG